MKTKAPSNPGPLSRALFTSLLAIAAACLSVGTAWTAHAQSPSPNLFASVNGTGKNGGASMFQYTPTAPTVQSTLASGLDRPRGLVFDSSGNIFAMSGSETNPTIDPMVTPLPPAIYMFTTTPAVVRRLFAGSTTFPSGQGPVGLACDTFRNLFVSTGDLSLSGNGEILEFAPDGTESTSLSPLD